MQSLLLAQVSQRTWLGTGLFASALLLLLIATLAAAGWWRRRGLASAGGTRLILRNSSLPFIMQLLTRGIDLGFSMVLYRFLSKGLIGNYEFAGLLVVQYLGTFADWGLTVLATREVARDHSLAARYFRTTLRLRLRLALLALPLGALFVLGYNLLAASGLTSNALSQRTITIIGLLGLTLFPAALSGAATALFQATERLLVPAMVNLLTNIASALLRTAALALGWGILGVAGGALAGACIGAALFGWALWRGAEGMALRGDVLPARPLLAEGWPLLLNSLLIGVFFRIDGFVINAYHGEDILATYNVAYKFINLTQIIPPVVVNAIFPLLARRALDDRAGLRRAYEGTLRWLILLALPLATGMMLLATPLVILLTSDEGYLPGAATALALTIWYLPFSFINGLSQYVLIALNRQHIITRAFVVTAIFNIGLNILLVPAYGFAASALITIGSELVLFWPLRRVLAAEIGAPPLLALLWRPALAAALMGGGIWLAGQVHLALAFAVALPLYLAALAALGAFTAADLRLLGRKAAPEPQEA